MKRTPIRFAAIATLALLVASCANDKKIQYCPGWTSVLDAFVVTQFKPGAATEPANALYTAKITDVDGSCTFDKEGKHADSDIEVTFEATRPSAGAATTYTIPYFVAVTQGARVVTRTVRSVTVSFGEGETTAASTEDVKDITLTTDGTNKPYNYQILVGFQLTKEQYDYNKTTGIFQQ